MSVIVRFAPSPTGKLHVGNIRQALVNWLFARNQGGQFLLRLDDTDTERSDPAYARAIEENLGWLGLTWDLWACQSDRLSRYDEAAEQLKASGRLYPCYETPEELGLKRKSALGRGKPPIYDRAALSLTDADRARYEAEGRKPHWRFKLDHEVISWTDLVRGDVRFQGGDLSDPVLIREDGRPLYTLSSVVDDIDFAITHVIRGEDHVANTATQVQLFRALGGTVPTFAHLTLLTDASGGGLSKRLGSLSVEELRDHRGLEPMAINSVLARLGTSDPVEPRHSLDDLAADFSFERFSRAAPKLDPVEFERINARLIHDLPHEAVADRLSALGLEGMDEGFWMAIRPNLSTVGEARDWWAVARGPVTPVIEDPDFARQAADLLPAEPWDTATWGQWVDAIKSATGRKGKGLFMPLRQALTGRSHGPELQNLLPLIGRDRAVRRLAGEAA